MWLPGWFSLGNRKKQGPVRGHAGSERLGHRRLLLLDFLCGLALGGLDRLVGSGVGGNLGFGRGCVLGLRRFGLRLARRMDCLAVDQNGKGSCRERVLSECWIQVGACYLKKKKELILCKTSY